MRTLTGVGWQEQVNEEAGARTHAPMWIRLVDPRLCHETVFFTER